MTPLFVLVQRPKGCASQSVCFRHGFFSVLGTIDEFNDIHDLRAAPRS